MLSDIVNMTPFLIPKTEGNTLSYKIQDDHFPKIFFPGAV